MARISLHPRRTVGYRLVSWVTRRKFGADLDPGRALGHNMRVLGTYAASELGVSAWNRLEADLKALAVLVAAAEIGCSWCMDFGYWENHHRGMDPDKLHDVPRWRDSDVYTPLERQVMEYAAAMSATPPTVTDDQAERLRIEIGEPALVELTAMVALENYRSRMNSAFGLTSQGFKQWCEVPQR